MTTLLSAVRVLRIGGWSLRVDDRAARTAGVLTVVILIMVAVSLCAGTIPVSPADLVGTLTGDASASTVRSVWGRRMPRALTALLVGAALAMSGAVFQSLSRNPLGSPDIIGFTTGAATGAVAQIVLFGGGVLETALAAVAGGLVTAVVVYLLARRDGVSGGIRLVLVGIGVGATMSALSALLLVRADINDATLAQVWSSGSLTGRGWPHAISLIAALAVLTPMLMACARSIAFIEMGDDTAQALGVSVERRRLQALILAVIAAAIAVAAAGPIAFVAFAAPQIARRIAPAPGVQLGVSALTGALLLLLADLLAAHLDIGLRTPVGLVTSLLGGMYLLSLLARRI
ncbi:FecCD family ABC transporter permease [Microbacterium saperdae]|uniref:Iron complex transport system permease protein n=1 Tax=Microbacterium saperdae TaxID=69368 RepID=A0A543BQD5_9MICO|nr:iron chelate uptake ABC transporter family permease subunit [Microbacterium saperdae]TQL87045.1 iron complex transport system permease protein [Microbacterium saperdae]GGM43289.1 ABC transporter permease [Microbacterium saperdae]